MLRTLQMLTEPALWFSPNAVTKCDRIRFEVTNCDLKAVQATSHRIVNRAVVLVFWLTRFFCSPSSSRRSSSSGMASEKRDPPHAETGKVDGAHRLDRS